MKPRFDPALARALSILALLCWTTAPASATEATPTAHDVLASVGFDADVMQQVMSGEIVEKSLDSTSERDLAAALVFLVRQPPEQFLDEIVREQLLSRVDPNSLSQGSFEGDSGPEALAALSLSPDERKLYAGARPGEDLNLSSAEIAALKALGGNEAAVEAELKKLLLARYRAYKQQGLAGIAPYDRGGKATDAAGDLRRASDAAHDIEKFDPDFFRYLHELPKNPPPTSERSSTGRATAPTASPPSSSPTASPRRSERRSPPCSASTTSAAATTSSRRRSASSR
jgi:hypothetical protein